eukprot:TRINITY_DN36_c1_g4_i1.p1 TRINITY_DN36_c1_g4~~TRINITY_DN36_c1_g4_i1.p1  ORF type:complete len:667 (-),score=193.70 TRINITY_DN36_c1_g4_i1:359-2359(-)
MDDFDELSDEQLKSFALGVETGTVSNGFLSKISKDASKKTQMVEAKKAVPKASFPMRATTKPKAKPTQQHKPMKFSNGSIFDQIDNQFQQDPSLASQYEMLVSPEKQTPMKRGEKPDYFGVDHSNVDSVKEVEKPWQSDKNSVNKRQTQPNKPDIPVTPAKFSVKAKAPITSRKTSGVSSRVSSRRAMAATLPTPTKRSNETIKCSTPSRKAKAFRTPIKSATLKAPLTPSMLKPPSAKKQVQGNHIRGSTPKNVISRKRKERDYGENAQECQNLLKRARMSTTTSIRQSIVNSGVLGNGSSRLSSVRNSLMNSAAIMSQPTNSQAMVDINAAEEELQRHLKPLMDDGLLKKRFEQKPISATAIIVETSTIDQPKEPENAIYEESDMEIDNATPMKSIEELFKQKEQGTNMDIQEYEKQETEHHEEVPPTPPSATQRKSLSLEDLPTPVKDTDTIDHESDTPPKKTPVKRKPMNANTNISREAPTLSALFSPPPKIAVKKPTIETSTTVSNSGTMPPNESSKKRQQRTPSRNTSSRTRSTPNKTQKSMFSAGLSRPTHRKPLSSRLTHHHNRKTNSSSLSNKTTTTTTRATSTPKKQTTSSTTGTRGISRRTPSKTTGTGTQGAGPRITTTGRKLPTTGMTRSTRTTRLTEPVRRPAAKKGFGFRG